MATIHNSSHAQTSILCSSVVSPKCWEGNLLLDRATVFCLRYRLQKHKTTRYARNLGGGAWPLLWSCG